MASTFTPKNLGHLGLGEPDGFFLGVHAASQPRGPEVQEAFGETAAQKGKEGLRQYLPKIGTCEACCEISRGKRKGLSINQ